MPTAETIAQQQKLLQTHRRTLETLLKQQAQLTSSFVPPNVVHGIAETRDEIRRIKAILRNWGVEVEDEPNDDELDEAAAPVPRAIRDLSPQQPLPPQSIGAFPSNRRPLVADVLIATVTEVEAMAVLDQSRDITGHTFVRHFIGDKTYHELGILGGATVFMVQSEMGVGGPSGALLTVQEGIKALAPAAVIMVGIAFGMGAKGQRIGDILVAQQLLGYELQRVSTGAEGSTAVQLRGDRPSASTRLLDRCRTGLLDWDGPTVQFGLVLSGEKLIDNQAFREQLRELAPEAIGGEMEGSGLYAAAQRSKVDWILVKAICDWADGSKRINKRARQHTAAQNAARFVLHVVRQGGFAKPHHTEQEPEMPRARPAQLRMNTAVAEPRPVVPADREQRNRSQMLQNVRDICRKRPEEIFGSEMRPVLDLQVRPDMVRSSRQSIVRQPVEQPYSMPPGTKIASIFDERGHKLLILGEPGSGKTTLLLELARDLLDRAERNREEPIPVVFNLSSWAEYRPPMARWLVEELNILYDVPREIGRTWVENDNIVPLLDGLDEVSQEYRDDCAAAIDAFQHEHNLGGLVVCSRTEDYKLLKSKLKLRGAIQIQSLTLQQVDEYLRAAGESFTGLRAALQYDTALRELVVSPLMLTIMMVVYRGQSITTLPVDDPAKEQRRLFGAYVTQRLSLEDKHRRYSPDQIISWLGWLAREMRQHGQSQFLIEGLQFTWLPDRVHKWLYSLTERLMISLIGAAAVGLIYGLTHNLRGGLVFGFASGLVGALYGSETTQSERQDRDFWWTFRKIATGGIILGCVLGFGMLNLYFGILGGVAGAFAGYVLGGLSMEPRFVKVVETFRWSWNRAIKVALGSGSLAGLATGMGVGSLSLFSFYGLTYGLGIGLYTALIVTLVAGLQGGLLSDTVEHTALPNQGIRRSTRIALWGGFGGGIIITLVATPIAYLINNFVRPIVGGNILSNPWLIGVLVGLFGAAYYGGFACIRHAVLRFLLWRCGTMPWNYARYLDYCAERVLLYKDGGSYRFMHRSLLEYFAELNPAASPADQIDPSQTIAQPPASM